MTALLCGVALLLFNAAEERDDVKGMALWIMGVLCMIQAALSLIKEFIP